jgi:hypothetical protein
MAQVQTPSLLPERLFDSPIADQRGYCRNQIWQRIFQILGTPGAIPKFTAGTHAQRLTTNAANLPDGSIYFESDRLHYYMVNNTAWQVLNGLMSGFQQNIPQDLGAVDAGFKYYVTDYTHTLLWTGAQWIWSDGEAGSGFIVAFPSAPVSFGWAACDGSTVEILGPDGILTPQVTPNTPGSYIRQ